MKTLIIPCAGRSLLNGRPKYLARHPEGEILAQKCVSGLPQKMFDRVLVTILQQDDEQYGAAALIQAAMPAAEVVLLPGETAGPAETIYQTLHAAKVSGEIVIKDSDNFLQVAELKYRNFAAGLDLNEWDRDVHNLRNKSFLIINEQKQILDIFEKQFKSDVISLGLYGFADAADFVLAYEHLNDTSYPIEKLYVSHIISYLIGYSQKVFHYIPCQEYETWGNERVWSSVQKAYATYFVDLDSIALDEANLNCMAKLQNSGAKLVGFTVGDERRKNELLQAAKAAGIHFLEVVCGCTHSEVKTVLESPARLTSAGYEL